MMIKWLVVCVLLLQSPATDQETGLFVKTLQWLQAFGKPAMVSPWDDRALKAAVAKAVAKGKTVSGKEIAYCLNENMFEKAAGSDNTLTFEEMNAMLDAATPTSRTQLLPRIRDYADYLATTFDMLPDKHFEASQKLADWIRKNYSPDKPLHVIIVCTGNSRRSMLGSCLGNMAAAYYGLDKLQFHSGGTAPSAFNRRTVATLQEIGFEITATGEEAPRGEPKTANPRFRVVWGKGQEAIEFSKRYGDQANPDSGFAAIMVCTEADGECPHVQGASLRLSMPFLDPKAYDDSKFEKQKYAERRDDIARVLMATVAMASRLKEESSPQSQSQGSGTR